MVMGGNIVPLRQRLPNVEDLTVTRCDDWRWGGPALSSMAHAIAAPDLVNGYADAVSFTAKPITQLARERRLDRAVRRVAERGARGALFTARELVAWWRSAGVHPTTVAEIRKEFVRG